MIHFRVCSLGGKQSQNKRVKADQPFIKTSMQLFSFITELSIAVVYVKQTKHRCSSLAVSSHPSPTKLT